MYLMNMKKSHYDRWKAAELIGLGSAPTAFTQEEFIIIFIKFDPGPMFVCLFCFFLSFFFFAVSSEGLSEFNRLLRQARGT